MQWENDEWNGGAEKELTCEGDFEVAAFGSVCWNIAFHCCWSCSTSSFSALIGAILGGKISLLSISRFWSIWRLSRCSVCCWKQDAWEKHFTRKRNDVMRSFLALEVANHGSHTSEHQILRIRWTMRLKSYTNRPERMMFWELHQVGHRMYIFTSRSNLGQLIN